MTEGVGRPIVERGDATAETGSAFCGSEGEDRPGM